MPTVQVLMCASLYVTVIVCNLAQALWCWTAMPGTRTTWWGCITLLPPSADLHSAYWQPIAVYARAYLHPAQLPHAWTALLCTRRRWWWQSSCCSLAWLAHAAFSLFIITSSDWPPLCASRTSQLSHEPDGVLPSQLTSCQLVHAALGAIALSAAWLALAQSCTG